MARTTAAKASTSVHERHNSLDPVAFGSKIITREPCVRPLTCENSTQTTSLREIKYSVAVYSLVRRVRLPLRHVPVVCDLSHCI